LRNARLLYALRQLSAWFTTLPSNKHSAPATADATQRAFTARRVARYLGCSAWRGAYVGAYGLTGNTWRRACSWTALNAATLSLGRRDSHLPRVSVLITATRDMRPRALLCLAIVLII